MKMSETDYPFLVTKEYRRFTEFCDACKRDKYIGLCYGPPGVGKTFSAKTYSSWHLIKEFDRNDFPFHKPKQIVPTELKEHNILFYTAGVIDSPSRVLAALIACEHKLQNIQYDALFSQLPLFPKYSDEEYKDMRIKNMVDKISTSLIELLIVDESDRLKLASLEQIRDYYDRENCGLILIGMPGMEKKLSRYAQLYSRIGFVHEFRALSQDEMLFIMKHHLDKLEIQLNPEDFTDHETLTAVIQTTRGNFRLLNRLFRQVERIMTLNQIKTLTKEIIFAARECLVIGT